ncbi:hypothetical protein GLOIN_2v722850 [Rhizophagus irregularis DAOM 181602=DAOM 197198]|uniref:Uncharacterized protein n=1 Tax=Rhizophagus irregularis (strain DAOM 181602 / DAOM 197198 / MUCL 43194) TaxID=747089 RepID=A0A2P4P737_RHIID|nr:hypothetical protein GLOIN_2v722850 [Rhizophagus irregularis DAOM 181602=DAOM 197198]POG61212.1 hypothetical protein GLOIN_2v722850 [Rhizophagus irregularis DAOM 181602=DAOM 197198]|eukprot:XP_025168078.1 hypothetical protein GLOIN_2v722850 [Rhizophagus irregularis DAOM 181602=DAOM 197198]
MPVVLITSVSPSGNLVTTKKFQDSKTSSNLFENNITDNNNITITTNNNDIDMTKNLINNGQNFSSMGNIEYITNFETFNERTYDDDKSSYQYNNFTNHNINKIVTEKNANENLNFKNNANLISIHENSIYTTSSSLSSSISSSFSSSFLSSSPESNVNNIINYLSMQHITTTSLNTINTVKNSLTSHLNQNIYDNNIINNSLNSNKISANLHGTKSNVLV